MKKYLPYIFLIVVGLMLVADLFHPGYPVTHDGRDHVVRIANFYLSLTEGNIIPRWAGNLNWGYGHAVMIFLYPLPSYIASFLHFAGFSLIDAYKIVLGLGVFASGLTMYLWLSKFLDPYSSTLGSVLYMFAPYRMIDAYVRGDIGENLAFVFVPLVLWAFKKLSEKVILQTVLLGAVSLGCVILSHNAIALLVMPFFAVYAAILWLQKKNRNFVLAMFAIFLLGFGLAAFFWIPGLLEGRYTLRNIVTRGMYIARFVQFPQLLYGPWNYGQTGTFTLQLGIIQWIGACVTAVVVIYELLKKKFGSEKDYLIVLSLISTIVSIFLMLRISDPIWQRIMILQNFQFPWRFLGLIVLTGAILGACAFSYIKKYQLFIFSAIILAIFIVQSSYFHAQKYLVVPESTFTGVYDGTTDTGESTPIWSIRFMEHRAAAPLEILIGNAKISQVSRTTTKHVYIVNASVPSVLLENTLYFPGWHIYIDGAEAAIQYQDRDHHGIMEVSVPQGQHKLEVIFKDTKTRFFSDILSLGSITIIVLGLGYLFGKHLKYGEK